MQPHCSEYSGSLGKLKLLDLCIYAEQFEAVCNWVALN